MKKVDRTKTEIERMIAEQALFVPLLAESSRGIILTDLERKTVYYCNDAAERIFEETQISCDQLEDIFSTKPFESSLEEDHFSTIINELPTEVSLIKAKGYLWIIIEDKSELSDIESISNKAKTLNQELVKAFSEYGEDTIMIVNGKGIIEFAGKAIANTCGMEANRFVGRNVFDIEKEGIFRPSVSVKILETKMPQAVIQRTAKGMELLSVGAPILDEEGNIEKVVSLTRDYSSQIKLSQMIGTLRSDTELPGQREDNIEDRVVTCNDKMFEVKTLARMIAPTDATVLITGETGTGKELLAEYIKDFSTRKDKPFIKVNCGTISHSIAESELFGYEEGSFTGASKGGKVGLIEAANGGTLFLDEIGELPMEQQVKLLHVLQERVLTRVGSVDTVDLDIRVIAATNKDLQEEVKNGTFREDLYYRLNVIPIEMPPLRERREDIPLLSNYFLKKYCSEYNKQVSISNKAFTQLGRFDWPGNIRQLKNTIERLVLTATKPAITENDLPSEFKSAISESDVTVRKIMRLDEAIEMLEKELLTMAIKEYNTTVKAAEVLGVNQSTVSRKLSQYKIKNK